MKKLFTILMAAALVFAVVGQVQASTFETKGEFRARYWYLSDYNTSALDHDSTQDFWDQRLRLNMGWQVSENVKVGARADILENTWDFTLGNDVVPAAGAKDEIDFDQAYVAFGLGPAAVTVGKQDVSWGTGMWVQADNRYRFKIGTKFDPVSISFALDNQAETFDTPNVGDNLGFSLAASMPVGSNSVGVLGWYAVAKATAGLERTAFGADAFFKGAVGPAKLNAEVAFASGENDYDPGYVDPVTLAPKFDNDFETMMAYVGAFMPAGPVSLGLEFAYNQGDDPKTSDKEGFYGQDYQGPFSSCILFNNFDLSGWVSNYSADTGVNNALAAKLSGAFSATKQLTLIGAAVWAQADTKVLPDGKTLTQDDDMGVEFDAIAKYAVTENVTTQVAFAYLAAGDYFGKNVDDPWVATVHFIVNF